MAASGLLTEVKSSWDGTETTADVSSGASSITVLDPSSLSVDDTVWINGFESKTVTAVDYDTGIVTLNSALSNSWESASAVVPDQGGGPGQVWLADVVVPSQEEPIEIQLGWTDLLSLSEGIYDPPVPVDLEDDLSSISNTPGQFFPIGGSRLAADAIDGRVITGSIIQTVVGLGSPGVQGMKIATDNAGGVIKFWTGNANEIAPGYINPFSTGGTFGVEIASPDRTGFARGKINLNPGDVEVFTKLTAHDGIVVSTAGLTVQVGGIIVQGGGLNVQAGGITVGGGGINVTGLSDFQQSVAIHTADLNITGAGNTVSIGNPPTGGTANVNWNSVNGNIRQIASTARVKDDIQTYSVDLEAALQLTPRVYQRNDLEPYEDPREIGFIAEEAEALGLTDWVVYGSDGLPFSFDYFKWVVALQALVQDQHDRLRALEEDA